MKPKKLNAEQRLRRIVTELESWRNGSVKWAVRYREKAALKDGKACEPTGGRLTRIECLQKSMDCERATKVYTAMLRFIEGTKDYAA